MTGKEASAREDPLPSCALVPWVEPCSYGAARCGQGGTDRLPGPRAGSRSPRKMVLAILEARVSHHRSAYPAGGRVASRQCVSREPRIEGGRGGLPGPEPS